MAAREAELVQYHRDGVSITLSDGDGRTENLTGGASAADSDPLESLCIISC